MNTRPEVRVTGVRGVRVTLYERVGDPSSSQAFVAAGMAKSGKLRLMKTVPPHLVSRSPLTRKQQPARKEDRYNNLPVIVSFEPVWALFL
eukprot:195153-Amphidinium_carterae.1